MNPDTPTINNMSSANWIATIYGQEELVVKLTKFELPSVDAGTTGIGNRTPYTIQTSGNSLTYENLQVEFLVDENLLNYRKLYKWMIDNTKRGIEDHASICIHFVGNDKRFQGVEVEFYEAFPISLSKIDLDTDGNETDVHCDVTFAYTSFDFVGETDRDADVDLSKYE